MSDSASAIVESPIGGCQQSTDLGGDIPPVGRCTIVRSNPLDRAEASRLYIECIRNRADGKPISDDDLQLALDALGISQRQHERNQNVAVQVADWRKQAALLYPAWKSADDDERALVAKIQQHEVEIAKLKSQQVSLWQGVSRYNALNASIHDAERQFGHLVGVAEQ